MYWGYKFEQFCTRLKNERVEEMQSNPNNYFCSIQNVIVGDHRCKDVLILCDIYFRLIMASEMDCYETVKKKVGETVVETRSYVELKTYKLIDDPVVFDIFKRQLFVLISFADGKV